MLKIGLTGGIGSGKSLVAKFLAEHGIVMISADRSLDYGTVMGVLGAVKQAGFTEVSLATDG